MTARVIDVLPGLAPAETRRASWCSLKAARGEHRRRMLRALVDGKPPSLRESQRHPLGSYPAVGQDEDPTL